VKTLGFHLSILILILAGCSAQSQLTSISGTLSLTPSLQSKIGASDVIFVMAYPLGGETRPASSNPIAVQKITPPVFPAPFHLSQKDVIFPERRFEGLLEIRARVDKDGKATTIESGDLEGSYKKNPVAVGSKDVELLIDQEK